MDGATLLQAAADAEQSSNHPLAKSILETAERARIAPQAVEEEGARLFEVEIELDPAAGVTALMTRDLRSEA